MFYARLIQQHGIRKCVQLYLLMVNSLKLLQFLDTNLSSNGLAATTIFTLFLVSIVYFCGKFESTTACIVSKQRLKCIAMFIGPKAVITQMVDSS